MTMTGKEYAKSRLEMEEGKLVPDPNVIAI